MKLTKSQADLLEAMQNGVVCKFMNYVGGSYCVRSDTMRRCTLTAHALFRHGLLIKTDDNVLVARKQNAAIPAAESTDNEVPKF
jgi:hypothetical protein